MHDTIDNLILDYQDRLKKINKKEKINIFLDDLRKTPSGFIRTYTVSETIKEMENNYGEINILSLDNDLGENIEEGYKVLDWLEYQIFMNKEYILPNKIVCHSANAVRLGYMLKLIKKLYSQ